MVVRFTGASSRYVMDLVLRSPIRPDVRVTLASCERQFERAECILEIALYHRRQGL